MMVKVLDETYLITERIKINIVGNVSQKRKHKLKDAPIYFRLIRPSS
jgi:hypothetical protein